MRPFGPKPCESRSTLAAARALNINAKLLYQWQKAAQQPLPADPHEAAEVRALRAQVQELEILKSRRQLPVLSAGFRSLRLREPSAIY